MKKIFSVLLVVLGLNISPAYAYLIDGNVSDWGLNLNSRHLGYMDSQTPSGGNNIDYWTEDNASNLTLNRYVGPGYSQGNRSDAEGIYFDNDDQYGYFLLVSGVSPADHLYSAGDIFFDTGRYQNSSSPSHNSKKYAYGIDISNKKLFSVNSWIAPDDHGGASPWEIGNNRTFINDTDFVYTPNSINDHYVMEGRFLLSDIGFGVPTSMQDDIWLHWTMECGNDILNLRGDVNRNVPPPVVPEPATLALMGVGLPALLRLRRKKV